MRQSRAVTGLFVIGLLLTLAAAWLPWVAFDPLTERSGRLEHLEALAADPSLPPFIRDELSARGIRPGLGAARLWSLLGQNDYKANFDFVRQHEQLFSWELLRLQSATRVKWLVVGVYLAVVIAAVLLVASIVGSSRQATKGARAEAWILEDISLEGDPHATSPPLIGVVVGLLAVVLLLALVCGPQLDTFGHVGEWGPGWLDVLSGARATIAPRVLLPLGLVLLLVAVGAIKGNR